MSICRVLETTLLAIFWLALDSSNPIGESSASFLFLIQDYQVGVRDLRRVNVRYYFSKSDLQPWTGAKKEGLKYCINIRVDTDDVTVCRLVAMANCFVWVSLPIHLHIIWSTQQNMLLEERWMLDSTLHCLKAPCLHCQVDKYLSITCSTDLQFAHPGQLYH